MRWRKGYSSEACRLNRTGDACPRRFEATGAQDTEDRVTDGHPDELLGPLEQHEGWGGAGVHAEHGEHGRIPEVDDAETRGRQDRGGSNERQPRLDREHGCELHVGTDQTKQQRGLERFETPAPEKRRRRQ
jgi:hypothetical protein